MMLRQIQYFVTIVRCHSFTRAAEESYISQSAISQQIKSLEEELGVELFKREKRSFTLTSAGEYFYRQALGILDELERIKLETIQIGTYHDSKLVVGLLDGVFNHEMRQAFAQFTSLYPEVEIEIKTGNHEDIYRMLQSNEVDMAINDQRRAFSENYINYHLTYSPCFIELCKDNPLSQLDIIQIEDLRRLPCILVSSAQEEENERSYYSHILGYGGHYLFARNIMTARILVASNKGFRPVEGLHKDRDNITYRPLYQGKQPLTRRYCFFWKKSKSSYYIEELANILYQILNP